MYVPEQGMKETLRTIATESAPGSALLLEYINRSKALKIISAESVQRYAMRQDGTRYGAHLDEVFRRRREAALQAGEDGLPEAQCFGKSVY